MRINGDGLRGPDLAAKPPGELRILSLGESTTFGAKLAYEETYSALLEQREKEKREREAAMLWGAAVNYCMGNRELAGSTVNLTTAWPL